MTRNRSITFLATAAVIPLTALALASCGGGNDATAATAPPKTANGQPATVGVANSGLGKILVDSQGAHALPVQEGRGDEERVLRRMRQRLAAAPGERQADSRRRRECVDGRNHHAVRRQATGHLQRPPALPLRGRPEAGRHERPGHNGVRRRLVRAISGGQPGLRTAIKLRRRIELGRRQRLLVQPRACARGTWRAEAFSASPSRPHVHRRSHEHDPQHRSRPKHLGATDAACK